MRDAATRRGSMYPEDAHSPMSIMTIYKVNSRGETVTSYTGEVVRRFAGGVYVEARWERPTLDLGYVRFEQGDRFGEWYYEDRWYNVFEIRAGDTGAFKGWYCNIAEPATISADTLTCRDLILDLWVAPDGTTLTLDEDEFAADTSLDGGTRAAAESAMLELRALVSSRVAPFDAISAPESAR